INILGDRVALIDTTATTLNSSSGGSDGGSISLTAQSDINTANLFTVSQGGSARNINITSLNGGVDTTNGSVESTSFFGNGVSLNISAFGDINIARMVTGSRKGDGGNITINSQNGAVNSTSDLGLSSLFGN
ncbi:hypothetical protein AFK68_09040, partial [Hydrocoleum sp. CS-953]|uniref:hypothetical protein n=1 Tax=Hydrocoleum sp. CS-953 TaxID=1671698 RepID=UPI000BC9B8F8